MEFHVFAPSKNLAPFIQGYLEADSLVSLSKTSHTLFPNGFSGIFFNMGGLGKLLIKQEYETPRVSVFGQIDQSFEAIHWPGSYSIGVLMKPTMLAKFLRVNMSEFTNRTFDGELLNPGLTTLHAQLEETCGTAQKIELLDSYFLAWIKTRTVANNVADAAIQLINQPSHPSVKKLAAQLNVSERYLETQFKNLVGLSPKTYSMIIRFKRVEQQLQRQSSAIWSHMDFAHEYYDQNHFIKEFKRFTGHTPSDYLLQSFDLGRSYLNY